MNATPATHDHPGLLLARAELAGEPAPPESAPVPATLPDGAPYDLDRDATIKRIRAALKKRSGKDWSIKGGSGTAWGWIDIDAPPRRRTWKFVQTTTPEPPAAGAVYRGANGVTPGRRVQDGAEDQILSPEDDPWAREAAEHGRALVYDWEVHDPAYKFGHASPADRAELAALLGLRGVHYQGHSIADAHDYRREYIDRAEGREPTARGEQYWD